ncbi:hypothetical protein E4U15_008096 [Claviceps sp. LM218 group G6]|nr:hypothetical protein E4U15_008096 [Claviceps sp. LM218 group G6]
MVLSETYIISASTRNVFQNNVFQNNVSRTSVSRTSISRTSISRTSIFRDNAFRDNAFRTSVPRHSALRHNVFRFIVFRTSRTMVFRIRRVRVCIAGTNVAWGNPRDLSGLLGVRADAHCSASVRL